MDIKILKSKQSAVEKYNLNEITFGSVFSDHMFVCDYEDNVWKNAKIIPYQDIKFPKLKCFSLRTSSF